MDSIRADMGDRWCHRCDYCQPCPQGIPISLILVTESIVKRMSYETAVQFLKPAMDKAATCTSCGECTERCPYDLNVPELIAGCRESYDRYAATGRWK
jgi:predicted aldo/keto reductase-like oxidoreductase